MCDLTTLDAKIYREVAVGVLKLCLILTFKG